MQSVTWLEFSYFEKYILEVSIATLERGGVTSKVDSYLFLDALDAWGLPKYPDRTVILPPGANLCEEIRVFIERNNAYLREPDCWLGTWIDPASGKCYLVITTICSCLEEAKRTAVALRHLAQRRIVALYNFKHAQTLYLQDNCC